MTKEISKVDPDQMMGKVRAISRRPKLVAEETPTMDTMMENIFNNEEYGWKIRAVIKDDKVLFIANDIAKALGYEVPKNAIAAHCKYLEILKGLDSQPFTSSPRGIGAIPEKDVYRLIMRSNLPSAEVFQDWVTDEILPSIRKTGTYSENRPLSKTEIILQAHNLLVEDARKEKLLRIEAEERADFAEKTKGYISSQKAASAMGTASAANKKVRKLESIIVEKDEIIHKQSKRIKKLKTWLREEKLLALPAPKEEVVYFAVTGIKWLNKYFEFSRPAYQQIGKTLTGIGKEMGFPIQEIPDKKFGSVKGHHKDTIQEFYLRVQEDPTLLKKYRKRTLSYEL